MARWGNRLALRIPRDLTAKSRLTSGVGGEPATKSDDFVVRRSAPNYDLSVLLAGVRPGNRPEEIATGQRWAKSCDEIKNRGPERGDWEDAERWPADAAKRRERGAVDFIQVAAEIFHRRGLPALRRHR